MAALHPYRPGHAHLALALLAQHREDVDDQDDAGDYGERTKDKEQGGEHRHVGAAILHVHRAVAVDLQAQRLIVRFCERRSNGIPGDIGALSSCRIEAHRQGVDAVLQAAELLGGGEVEEHVPAAPYAPYRFSSHDSLNGQVKSDWLIAQGGRGAECDDITGREVQYAGEVLVDEYMSIGRQHADGRAVRRYEAAQTGDGGGRQAIDRDGRQRDPALEVPDSRPCRQEPFSRVNVVDQEELVPDR